MDRRLFIGSATACTCALISHSAHSQNDVDTDIDFCTIVPTDDESTSRALAITEWDGNRIDSDIDPMEAAARRAKRWNPSRRELKVAFLTEGNLADRIFTQAKGWEPHMPLKFRRVGLQEKPEILVNMVPGNGHWSSVGTDSLIKIGQGLQSMNFGWTSNPSDQEVRRVSLHEFGHAMALVHEHKVPNAGIDWNLPAVYAYYAETQGWTQEQTDSNVLKPYSENQINRTSYDRTSIMHYPIPRELVNDPSDVVGYNTVLSNADKAMANWLWT